MAFSGPVPTERKHRIQMAGIEDSSYPEQVISLPNPALLLPKVTTDVKKSIFRTDEDGNTKIRDDKVNLEKADMDANYMVPLSVNGRDEAYLENQLWLMGISSAIVWGVGNGMLLHVCLKLRIPVLAIFEKPTHKDVIFDLLQEKLVTYMNDPKCHRFYKSDMVLGIEASSKPADKQKQPEQPEPKTKPKKFFKNSPKKKVKPPTEPVTGSQKSSSSSSSSHSD